jgi:hypothetical protein
MRRIQYVQNNRTGYVREYVHSHRLDLEGFEFGQAVDLSHHRANAVTPWPVGAMPTEPTVVDAAQAGPPRGGLRYGGYRDYIAFAFATGGDSRARVDAWAAQASQGRGVGSVERHQDGIFDGTQTRFEGDRPWMWLPDGPNGPGIY